MDKAALIQKAIEKISRLPEQELQEVNDFAEFLLSRIQHKILSEEVSASNAASSSYKFLEEEPDIYTVNDVKAKYTK